MIFTTSPLSSESIKMIPATPLLILRHVLTSDSISSVVVATPKMSVGTGTSPLHPSLSTHPSTCQVSLVNGAIYTVTRGTPSYLVRPFDVEVSIAPVCPLPGVGVAGVGVVGVGVHVNMNLLHLSISKDQVNNKV